MAIFLSVVVVLLGLVAVAGVIAFMFEAENGCD